MDVSAAFFRQQHSKVSISQQNFELWTLWGLRAKFPKNPNSKRQRSQKGANVGDGLRRFETRDANQPRHDKDRGQEIQALAAHREQGGLPSVADVLKQHVGTSA